MKHDQLKKQVSLAVLDYIPYNAIVGFGSGSTVIHFIKAIVEKKKNFFGAVSSSYHTTIMLKKYGITVLELNTITKPIIYIDSADEVNFSLEMIKGGGGALTKEKIISAMSEKFICIIDESKLVQTLGVFPLPIEVVPIAYSYISKKMTDFGGKPRYREGFVTDQGNIIIDVYGLNLNCPINVEKTFNSIPGIVTVGLFSIQKPNLLLVGTKSGIKIFK
ncbi:ribose-5-phosphate isomerase RpiA [Buchnera aphidicola]|uniref:Ribose-5-phosphate isomerase A n=1 Tax=Buchnera aphidicola (Sarucallis kahawaluokalani) TaxID=1241878 RepID=A0A4D6YM35_9GAMM|nr:ribose-5-phosphate isomerase RpiA [Buchnera aphidicola]QCI26065.1 ribose-5-phosphate isomerase RpiA [Buchnera aphidicola (Sarucallis kahawaluokalani)]